MTTAEFWDEYRAQRPELPPARLMDSFKHDRTFQVVREFGRIDGPRFGACLEWAASRGNALEVWV